MNQKDAFLLSITTLLTIIAWVGSNIYHASVTSTVPDSLERSVKPIEGKFDTEVIDSIKKRQKVQPVSQLIQSTPSATPTPSLSPSPTSTSSAQQNQGSGVEL